MDDGHTALPNPRTELPTNSPSVIVPNQGAEEDVFTADIVKSLSTAQYDDDILEYINLLNAGDSTAPTKEDFRRDIWCFHFTSNDWERHRAELEALYSEENYKLKDIMRIMRDKYNLSAGETQYRRKFARWGLEKNVKFNEMRKIVQIWMRRKQEGKESSFLVRNKLVSLAKIQRFQRRTGASVTESSPSWPTPSHITYFTPQLVSTTSLTGSRDESSSSTLDTMDATEQTLDFLSLYMTTNPQSTLDPVSETSTNFDVSMPEQSRAAPTIPQPPRVSSSIFEQCSAYSSSSDSRAARIPEEHLNELMSSQWQNKYWNASGATSIELLGIHTLIQALQGPFMPSYHLASVWYDVPNVQDFLFHVENTILGLKPSTAPPDDEDIDQLLNRAIIYDDRETVILVLRYQYQQKHDFESRCPIQFLDLAKSFNRYELFGLLIMNGVLGNDGTSIDEIRLQQAQCYLQYGYPFLPENEQQGIFFLFLHATNIATSAAITSWLLDALVHGHSYALIILDQYRYCWDLDFISSQVPILYKAIQGNPECLLLVQTFITKAENGLVRWQQLQLFLATALLQNTVAEYILSGQIAVNAKNYRGQTALHNTAMIDYGDGTEITNTLLKHGIKVDAKDCSGNTCLHSAFQSTWKPWKERFVRTVIQAKADINAQNLLGQTCLAIVATHWDINQAEEMMEWLTTLGADPTIVNGQGQTPSQILQLRKHR